MPHFSASTIVLLIIAALIFFGPSKLPELGRAFGRTLKEFKNGAKEIMSPDEPPVSSATRKEIAAEEVRPQLEPSPGRAGERDVG